MLSVRRRACAVLIAGLAVAPGAGAPAQERPPALEADLAKGIALVEEGDYDAAIVVLDGVVARLGRLQEQKARVARAHLYLGIAYVGEAQESLATASFREALRYDPGLTLDAAQFSPKVREHFQRVKNEATAARAAAPGTPPAAGAAEAKRGSKTPLLLVLGGAAVAGGVLAASGGGDESTSPTTTTTPAAPAPSSDIALVSVSPAGGSTLSLGAGGEVLRVVVTVTHTTAGNYRLFAANLHQGGTGRECVCGVSDSLALVPGQRVTSSVGLRTPCLGGLPSCPALPFASTGLTVHLYTDDPAENIVIPERTFPVTYTFTR